MGKIADTANFIGSKIVGDKVSIMDNAEVYYSKISENAQIYESAYLYEVDVRGDAHVFGKAMLENNLITSHNVVISDGCKIGGFATFTSLGTPEDFVAKYGEDKVEIREKDMVLTNVWDMGI